jgi:hypothetical protein
VVAITTDLAILHALLGHYARQHADVQRTRLMVENRIRAMTEGGLGDEWTLPLRRQLDELVILEASMERELEGLMRQHPMAGFIRTDAKGLSLRSFALLFGSTGPLDRFATVSKLWAYLGMHVVDGAAPRRVQGQSANWSAQGRVRCWLIAESIVRVGEGGRYREAYDRKKAEYETARPDWTQLRRHNAAKRYAVKELLKDLWIEWRSRVAQPAGPLAF